MEKKNLLLGAAFAGLVLGTSGCASKSTAPAAGSSVSGECHGINACKGQGACGGKGHGCAGQNKCKGHGWLKMTKKECSEKGGTFKS